MPQRLRVSASCAWLFPHVWFRRRNKNTGVSRPKQIVSLCLSLGGTSLNRQLANRRSNRLLSSRSQVRQLQPAVLSLNCQSSSMLISTLTTNTTIFRLYAKPFRSNILAVRLSSDRLLVDVGPSLRCCGLSRSPCPTLNESAALLKKM